jgi:hypothetical protein
LFAASNAARGAALLGGSAAAPVGVLVKKPVNLHVERSRPMNHECRFMLFTIAFVSTFALADDRADYNRRSAERYIALFDAADVNKDNVVSRPEARGTIELEAQFNELDVNRDDKITRDELTRYIDLTFR